MKTKYMHSGTAYMPTFDTLANELPVASYRVCASPKGFYLDRADDFALPPKLYGDTERHAARVLSTFDDRAGTTGVLLSGEKGSGKSLLAKKIAVDARVRLGLPTLIISEPFCGDEFNAFMKLIAQPCVVLIDEFEKVYSDMRAQQALLTLLDGMYTSKKLFVLTCNNKYAIDSHMKNRPGRIFYAIDYVGLSREFIEEYCADQKLPADRIRGVVNVAAMFHDFNFDMLKGIVEEMLRYGETAAEAIKMLNVQPASENEGLYDVTLTVDGKPVEVVRYQRVYRGNPIRMDDSTFSYGHKKQGVPQAISESIEPVDPDEDDFSRSVSFGAEHLTNFSSVDNVWTYTNGGAVLKLRKQVVTRLDVGHFIG